MNQTAGGVTDQMRRLVRESVSDLKAAEPDALVPLKNMAPHFISFSGDHPQNGLVKLFTVDVDGKDVHIYLKQE